MTVIIGLAGRAGAGKDTAAAGLVREGGFVRIGLADAVKEAVTVLTPLVSDRISVKTMLYAEGWSGDMRDDSFLPAWDVVKQHHEARRLLQMMGTEVARDMFGDDVWVNRMLAKAARHARVVVPDVRFNNEAKAILDAGGTVITIVRPGLVRINDHASEQPLHPELAPFQILNDQTPEILQQMVVERVMPYVLYPQRYVTGAELTGIRNDLAPCQPMACPDCKAGKHANCGERAWCVEHDHEVPCPCTDISH